MPPGGIRSRSLSRRAAADYALDRTATGIGLVYIDNDKLHLVSCIVPATAVWMQYFPCLFYLQGINLVWIHKM